MIPGFVIDVVATDTSNFSDGEGVEANGAFTPFGILSDLQSWFFSGKFYITGPLQTNICISRTRERV